MIVVDTNIISYLYISGERSGQVERLLSVDAHWSAPVLWRSEFRSVLARYLPGEEALTIWTSTQIPHLARTQLALMLRFPENRIRVIAPEVGGGFGCKLNVYAEEGLLGFLALKLKRPVKWIEGRGENFQATIHGRGQVGTVEAAVKKDGTILGLAYEVIADIGAYHQLLTPGLPPLTGLMIRGCYKIPTASFKATGVFTNKMATDAYRGAGRPEALYVIERTPGSDCARARYGSRGAAPEKFSQFRGFSIRNGDRVDLRQR